MCVCLAGACPTCRKDPILAMNSGIPPLSELRGGVQGEETELDVLQDVGFVSTQGDIEQGVIQGAMVPVGTWDGEGVDGHRGEALAHLNGGGGGGAEGRVQWKMGTAGKWASRDSG